MTSAPHEDRDRESPDDPIVPLVERCLGEPRGAASGRETLAVWEMRAAATTRDGDGASIDGGARVECRAPGEHEPCGATFAAGAGPGSVGALGDGILEPDAEGWGAIAGELIARVTSARERAGHACADATRGLAAAPGEAPPRLIVEARARVRALRRGGRGSFETTLEQGLRIAALSPRRGRPLGERVLAGLDVSSDELRAVIAGILDASCAARRRYAETDAAVAVPTPRAGRVVLLPAAAAWWVHELAHAAFEGVGRRAAAAAHGVRIVEDPASSPWPAGFAVDDLGEPARRSVLWGGRDEAAPERGHARRASIRDDAFPGPAVTRLESDGSEEIAISDVPEGTRVVTSARAGRLDPLTACVMLHVDGLGVLRSGEVVPSRGEGVLTMKVDEGWSGSRVVTGGPPPTLFSALCTRQGRALPVMVGAPTVLIEPVRFTKA